MKRILWCPNTDRQSAGSRLRVFEVADALKRHGYCNSTFIGDSASTLPDILYVQKNCDHRIVSLTRLLRNHGVKTIFDVCDPVWLQPKRVTEFESALPGYDRVTVPTISLCQSFLSRYPGMDCRVTPDSLDFETNHFPERPLHERQDDLRIGWFGDSSNLPHLLPLVPVFQRLRKAFRFTLRIITASTPSGIPCMPHIPLEFVPWQLHTYLQHLATCDMIVIPVALNAWTRGKSANRLQLCMALGVPAVVSPLQSYLEMLNPSNAAAIVAQTENDWHDALMRLRDPALRNGMARKGFEIAHESHALTKHLPTWADALLNFGQDVKTAGPVQVVDRLPINPSVAATAAA